LIFANILILQNKIFLKNQKKVLHLNHRLNHTSKTPKNNVISNRYKNTIITKKVLKTGGKRMDSRVRPENDRDWG